MELGSFHIGKHIKRELRNQGRSVTWLSRTICHERSSIYKMFGRDNIDIKLLMRISHVLNHDFFADISEKEFGSGSKVSTKTRPKNQQN